MEGRPSRAAIEGVFPSPRREDYDRSVGAVPGRLEGVVPRQVRDHTVDIGGHCEPIRRESDGRQGRRLAALEHAAGVAARGQGLFFNGSKDRVVFLHHDRKVVVHVERDHRRRSIARY